jgi:hypothetical protein
LIFELLSSIYSSFDELSRKILRAPGRAPLPERRKGYAENHVAVKNKKIRMNNIVKSQKGGFPAIPAEAGIQFFSPVISSLDSGFHRSDDFLRNHQNFKGNENKEEES